MDKFISGPYRFPQECPVNSLKDSKKTLHRERDGGGVKGRGGGCCARKMICLMQAMFSCNRNAISDIKT